MKRILIVIGLIILFTTTEVKADEIEVYHTWATAYCLTGTTASGTRTIEGKTVAGKPEWIGSTMILWMDDGDGLIKPENYIGTYTVEDTGGSTIRNGTVIDIYISDYDRAVQFGSKRVVFQIIKAEG